MKNIFTFCLLAVFLTGCYDDEGNYSYHEINKIEGITGGVDSVIYIRQFDTLKCTPQFTGSQYSNPEAYTYAWEIEQKIVSRDLNLVYPVVLPYGDKNCRFIITDKKQGNQYTFPFRLIISSESAGDMIMVLSNCQGKAEISYKALRPDTLPFVINYYERTTGRILGQHPQKLYRNYLPLEAFSGILAGTSEGMKSLADTTLLNIGGNTCLDEDFLKRQIVYPQPSVPGFAPQTVWSGIHDWGFVFGNPGGKGSKNILISDGKLYSCILSLQGKYMLSRSWLLDKASPYGGKLSPVYFPVGMKAAAGDIFFQTLAFDISDYGVTFDETAGRFLLVSALGNSMKEIDKEKIPDYAGHRLIFGSHTNLPNVCIAILSQKDQIKALELQFPEKSEDPAKMKVLAEMDMPSDIMNSHSDFYQYQTTEFILVSTGNRLLTGNIREWESGKTPQPVFSLDAIGYDGKAEISCFEMSRSEQSIVLGISRYGNDPEGSGEELKGDVVVLDAKTFKVRKDSNGKDMIYRSVCGYPTDIMIKWQNWYRFGKNHNNQLMDVL